jgi:signal peptidase II
MPARNLARALAVAVLVFGLDRALKIWVVDGLDLGTRLFIPVLDPWLNLTMAWNEGINFGLFDFGAAGRWVLVGVALAICAALLAWVRHAPGWVSPLGAGLIVGGALGNVWDRVRWGAVADFINMSCCGMRNPFAFNVADAAIFGGAALLVFAGSRKKA